MPVFQYRALQASGGVTEGQVEAAGRHEAFQLMAGQGLRPISLSEQAASAARSVLAPTPGNALPFLKQSDKISARALENFTRLLSSLLAAGVPLSRALTILYREASNPGAT